MVENVIPRKYNYNLETGTVGTDNEDMANILYNINRMEIKAAHETKDVADMQKVFGEAFVLALDSSKHFKAFAEKGGEKLNAADADAVKLSFSQAVVILGSLPPPQTDIEIMSTSVKAAYQKMLDAVPSLLQLDEQSL